MAYPTLLDLASDVKVVSCIDPAALTATADGATVSLEGFNSATFVYNVGTLTDGSYVIKIEESADDSTWTEVAAADLIGTAAALAADTNQKLGYRGGHAYVRAGVTVTGATTGVELYTGVLLGHPQHGAAEGSGSPIIT